MRKMRCINATSSTKIFKINSQYRDGILFVTLQKNRYYDKIYNN